MHAINEVTIALGPSTVIGSLQTMYIFMFFFKKAASLGLIERRTAGLCVCMDDKIGDQKRAGGGAQGARPQDMDKNSATVSELDLTRKGTFANRIEAEQSVSALKHGCTHVKRCLTPTPTPTPPPPPLPSPLTPPRPS